MATFQKESNVELNNSTFLSKQRLLSSGSTSDNDSNFVSQRRDNSSNAINDDSKEGEKKFLETLFKIQDDSTFLSKQRLLSSGSTSDKFVSQRRDNSSNAINDNSKEGEKRFLQTLFKIPDDDEIRRIEKAYAHPYLLDDWREYLQYLIDLKGDSSIKNNIAHFHSFAEFMTDPRTTLVWLALIAYYIMGFFAIMWYANVWDTQFVYYLTNLLLLKVAYECILVLKIRLFGELTDDFEYEEDIGSYELLDVIY